jgi:hypothetical protein
LPFSRMLAFLLPRALTEIGSKVQFVVFAIFFARYLRVRNLNARPKLRRPVTKAYLQKFLIHFSRTKQGDCANVKQYPTFLLGHSPLRIASCLDGSLLQ